jgi:hypothetical protein
MRTKRGSQKIIYYPVLLILARKWRGGGGQSPPPPLNFIAGLSNVYYPSPIV